jgi:hypothetical protein
MNQQLGFGQAASMSQYLQLPNEPSRVRALAQHLTEGILSPSGQVDRLVQYLRDSGRFEYDTSAGSPANVDAVDDFLFRSRRGYCNQFATALAVLAREIDLPSRLITGYTTGTERYGTFVVRQRDGHSWVEIYLQDQGWVTVDPTPGFDVAAGGPAPATRSTYIGRRPGYVASTTQPLRTREGQSQRGRPHRTTSRPPAAARPGSLPATPVWPLAVLAVLSLFLLIAFFRRPWTPRRIYAALAAGHNRAGLRIGPAETPREFAERFREQAGQYECARLIVELYVREQYAGLVPNEQERRAVKEAWSHVRGRRFRFRPAYSMVARR